MKISCFKTTWKKFGWVGGKSVSVSATPGGHRVEWGLLWWMQTGSQRIPHRVRG